MKILIAEDSRIVRESMEKFLESHSYDVSTAVDGLSAWKAIRSDKEINFLIVDWKMPGMDGVELVKKVRELDRDFYILFVTANAGTLNLQKAIEHGADDFIPKPYDTLELLARIKAGERIVFMLKDRSNLAKTASRASVRLRRINKFLEFKSDRDHATGLYNRRGVKRVLEKFTTLERRSQNLALMVIDVDKFKFINDTYGHDVGDEVVKSVARTIKKTVGKDALVARWGGDEFLVLRLGGKRGMDTLYERISNEISLKTFSERGVSVSITGGIASGRTLDFPGVFSKADNELLRRKRIKKAVCRS